MLRKLVPKLSAESSPLLGKFYDSIVNCSEFASMKRIARLFSHYFNIIYKQCNFALVTMPFFLKGLSNDWQKLVDASDELLEVSKSMSTHRRRRSDLKLNRFVAHSADPDIDHELAESMRFADSLYKDGPSAVNSFKERSYSQGASTVLDPFFLPFIKELDDIPNTAQNLPDFLGNWLLNVQAQFELPSVKFTCFVLCSAIAYHTSGLSRMLAIAFASYCATQCIITIPAVKRFLFDPVALYTSMPPEPTTTLPYIKRILKNLSNFLFASAGEILKATLSLFKIDHTEILNPMPTLPKFGSAPRIITRRCFALSYLHNFPNPTSFDDPCCDNVSLGPDGTTLLENFFLDQKVKFMKPWYHPRNYLSLFKMRLDTMPNAMLIPIIYALARRWERFEAYYTYKSDSLSSFMTAVNHWCDVPVTFKRFPIVPISDVPYDSMVVAFDNWPKRSEFYVNPLPSRPNSDMDYIKGMITTFVKQHVTCEDEIPLALTPPTDMFGTLLPRPWTYDMVKGFIVHGKAPDVKVEEEPDNVAQSFMTSWKGFINYICSIFDKDSVLGSERNQQCMRSFNTAYTAFSKLSPLVAWIPASILTIIDTIGVSLFGYSPSFTLKPKLRNEITALLDEVTKLEASVALDKNTADMVYRIEDLSKRFAIASSQLHILDQGDTRAIHFRAGHRRFCELAIAARARHASVTPRCPPVCVYLPGPPGIGKTQIAQALARELALPLRNGEPALLRNKETYTMDFSANFQDGLTNQATIIADEWNTFNNPEMRLQGISWLLAAVNSTQIVVEKARAEEKGMYYFNAELLFLTSNGELSSLNSLLADPMAINRRISFTVDIIPPAMKDGVFPQLPDGRIDFSQFTFSVTPFGEAVKVVKFQELFELISRRIVMTRKLFNSGVDGQGDFISQIDRSKLDDLQYVGVSHVHEPIGGVHPPAPYKAQGFFNDNFWSHKSENTRLIISTVYNHRDKIDDKKTCSYSDFLKWIAKPANTIGVPYLFDCAPSDFSQWQAVMFALGHSKLPALSPASTVEDYDYLSMVKELAEMPALRTEKRPSCCTIWWERLKLNSIKSYRYFKSFVPTGRNTFKWACSQMIGLNLDTFWKYLKLSVVFIVGGFVAYGAYAVATANTVKTQLYQFTWDRPFEERFLSAQGLVGSGNARREVLEKHRRNRRTLNMDGEFIHAKEKFSTSDYHPSRSHKTREQEVREFERGKGGKGRGGVMYRAQSALPDLSKTAGRNTAFITTPYDVEYRVISPGGHYIIMPHHYLMVLRDAGECTITSDSGSAKIDLSKIDIYTRPDMDMCAFVAPAQLPSFPEISHRFITDDDVPYVNDSFAHFLKSESGEMSVTSLSETVSPSTQVWTTSEAASQEESYVAAVFSFKHSTHVGDCGSLYASHKGMLTHRNFVGYHVAGNGRNAQCTILTQEDIQAVYDAFEGTYAVPNITQGFVSLLKSAPVLEAETEINPMFEPQVHSEADFNQFLKYPTAPPDAVILSCNQTTLHSSRRTRLVPGMLSGILGEPQSAPALMTAKDDPLGRDPLLEAYRRQTTLPLDIEDVPKKLLFESAAAALSYVPKYQNGLTRTLNPYEAVLGIHALSPMKLSSSAGEPYNSIASSLKKPPTKETWIKVPQNNMVHFDPVLWAEIKDTMNLLKQGIVPFWYVTDQLKDEAVSFTKIEACKTRLYYTASVLHIVIGRMLFGSLISALEDARLKHIGLASCAVGMSTEDVAVRSMFREIKDDSKQIYAMDQKGFDNHQHWAIGRHVARAINAWYGECGELSLARYTFLKSCYHSVHRNGRILYQVSSGMPSGIAITAQLNSLYLETTTIAAIHMWSKTRVDLDGVKIPSLGVKAIKDAMFAMYYGDDSWFSFPKCFGLKSKDLFFFYRKFGLEATHCLKDYDLDLEVPADETSFLKRRPVLNESGELVFRKDLDDIADIFSWVKKKYAGVWPIQNAITASVLYEYRRYGIKLFEEKLAIIMEAYAAFGLSFPLSRDQRDYVIE